MFKMIAQRLLTAIPTLLAIIILSFVLMRIAPGGPFDGERPLAPEVRAALEAAYGLDKSLPEQVWMYLSRLAQGDFGPSMVYRDFTVSGLIAEALPVSLLIGGCALVLAALLGISAGLWAALRAGKWQDELLMLGATLLTALPTFVTGPLLALPAASQRVLVQVGFRLPASQPS